MELLNIQVRFFQHLRSALQPHLSLVDEIADLLEISKDSAYRRIRGEKPVSLEELHKLGAKFKVSLDKLLQLQSDSFIFSGNLTNSTDFRFTDYLHDLLRQFQFMNNFSHKHLYALVKDITPMHHFQIPELASFRCFFWMKSILHYEEFKEKKFSIGDISQEHVELAKKIADAYCKIPTTEIWNIETVNSTLRQIRFYKDSNFFASDADMVLLYDKIEELVDHIEKQAEAGVKFRIGENPELNSVPFVLMNNELILGDNTFLCELDNFRATYINHGVINFMMTRDEHYNRYMFGVLQNLIRKSSQLSVVGQKERSRFFNRIREKVYQSSSNK
jgi:hypothetical protein